jgi:hypothetical protein
MYGDTKVGRAAAKRVIAHHKVAASAIRTADDVVHPHPMNITATQQFLKSKGYAIPVDGQMGTLTSRAMKDWQSGSRNRNPGRFNKAHNLVGQGPGGNSAPPHKDHSVGGKSRASTGTAGGTGAMDALGASLSGDLKALSKLAAQGVPVPLSRLKSLGTPAEIAKHAADLKYGAELSGLNRDITRGREQGQQNLADLSSWFGQIRGHLDTATAEDAAAGERNISAQGDADRAIVASLGGAANPASADISHEAENSTALMRMLSEAQGNYDRSAQTQLGAEAVSARTKQSNLDQQRAADLVGKLRDLQGEKGAYQATTQDEARQQGLSNEMNLRQFNETLRGNKFQRESAVPGLRIAAGMAGLNADALKANIQQTRAGTQAIKQGRSRTGAGGSRSTGALTQNELGKAVDTIVGHLRTPVTVTNPDGTKASHGQFEGRPAQAASYVLTTLRGYGIDPSSKAGRSLALQILSSGVKGFNANYYNKLLGPLPKPRKKR